MIAIASDHVGLSLKREIFQFLEDLKLPCKDVGTYGIERADYPIWGYKAARLVVSGECDRGIIICGTGVGISLASQ